MDKNDVSLFSFNQETSFIIYKKVCLLTPEIQAISNQRKSQKLTASFFYDKYTNQFIYINGEIIILLDTKCKMKTFSRIKFEEKIKTITVEYNNKYILITTFDYKLYIINLQDLENVDFSFNKKAEYTGGFFIKYKRPERVHDYFIVCLMTKNNFHIKRILKTKNEYDNSFKYSIKSNYISNKMKLLDYDFNHVFKVLLIIKSNPFSFVLFNLKSKSCYNVSIIINIENLKENENKLYMQQIYKKLYLIHLDNKNFINIFRLNNIKKMKSPRKIKYNNKDDVKISDIKLQFYNNLIILYKPNVIKIYDIKSKSNNYEISILDIPDKDFKIFINANIIGKFLLINDEYYKIKFSKRKYKNDSNILSKDVFFDILRRKNSNLIIKEILLEYLNNFNIWNFFDVLEGIIINHKKFLNKTSLCILDDKNNPYTILYIGNNQFFLAEDYLLTLFNQYFDKKIKPEMIIKALCYLFHLYKKYEFDWNINLFYASLFAQLNKIDDIYLIEYIIKNQVIPVNEKIGMYFIMKAKSIINEKIKSKKFFNLGVDILRSEKENFDNNILEILKDFNNINNNYFEETFESILDIFFKNPV